MDFSRPLLALALLAGSSVALAADPLLPQAGMLVLKNGQVLEGEITRAGDFYVVTLGATGEVRLPAADVELQCQSLDEAYAHKLDSIFPRGAKGHLDLADWCLRHRLLARSAEQLVAAMKLEPNNPRIAELDRRLTLAGESPPVAATKVPTSSTTVSTEQLDKALRELPASSVEKFSAVVQPILLNRCGANQCHGPNAKSTFSLLKPPPGTSATRRFTQRNLYAALQQIDQSQPEASPLLTLPQRRHGSALAAVFDKHTQKQLDELTSWVKLTLIHKPATVPATIPTADKTTLSQTAPSEHAPATDGAATAAMPSRSLADEVRAMRPVGDPAAQKPVVTNEFIPRDEFDPELFNRRYGTKGSLVVPR